MKKSLNSLKALAVGAALAAAAIAAPAEAASLRFAPPGAQLDATADRDLVANEGDVNVLQIFLDVFPDELISGDSINKVDFSFAWDAAEVAIQSFVGFSAPASASFLNPSNVAIGGLNITGPSSTLLAEFTFKALAGVTDDGLAIGNDLQILSAALSGGGTVGGLFLGRPAGIDVQPTAVPTPALLPGLIGMGMALVRKRRNQSDEQAA